MDQFDFTHTRLSCRFKCADQVGVMCMGETRDCCLEQPPRMCDQLRFQVIPDISGQFTVQYWPEENPSLAINITVRYRKLETA